MSKKTTKCIVCGKTIEYNTKKPKWCSECKKNKNAVRKPRGRSKKTKTTPWKSETYMFKVLNEMFPKTNYCINGYYSWLPSPKGEPMQLDWYSYELGLAFEYEGIQHYKYSRYFHKTKQEFKYLQECDKLKQELCEKEGVTLVTIKYDLNMNVRTIANELKKKNKILFKSLVRDKILNLTKEDLEAIRRME